MTRRYADISRPKPAWTFGDRVMIGIAALLPATLFLIAFLELVLPAHATFQPEYAKSPQAVRDWFATAETTRAVTIRLGIHTCCAQSERLMTKFVGGAGNDWSYYTDPSCTHKGCALLPIPNDVVHDEPIKALNPADNDLPEFKEMRREGVLFIWNGVPTCFWPPEGGI